MNDALSTAAFEALAIIGRGLKNKKLPPEVAPHIKHLFGLKYVSYRRDGNIAITDKGRDALFVKSCIDGLRSVATNPLTKLEREVITLLEKKGHIKARTEEGGYEITTKGLESLADIDAIK